MDRNTLIGFSLIFALILGYTWVMQPSQQELDTLKHQQDSIALVARQQDSLSKLKTVEQVKEQIAIKNDSSAANGRYGVFAPFVTGTDEFYTIENKEMRVEIASKGGRIRSVLLKNYKRYDKSPLILFEGRHNQFAYTFQTAANKLINTADLYFTPSAATVKVPDNGKASIVLSLKISEQQSLEQIYTLESDGFVMGYDLKLKGMDQVLAPAANMLTLNWSSLIPVQERSAKAEQRTATIYYCVNKDEVDYLKEMSDDDKTVDAQVNWISYKQQYFNSTLICSKPLEKVQMKSRNDESGNHVKRYETTAGIQISNPASETVNMRFYFGPNQYKTLEKLDIELERIVPMGWLVFRWVNKYLIKNLFEFLTTYIGNFGLIILLMTIVIKICLFPLVYKSYLSTAKMRLLKPEIDEIKEKYGDDMQKVQTENMKIYNQAGVSPMGGCLPVLLQMPILIAMFSFFPSAFELRQQAFLWANDLSTYDSIWTFGTIPGLDYIYGDHVSLFTLLMTSSTLIYTHLNNQLTGVTGQMKWIGYLMPVIFLGVFNNYAAGLSYYYFVSTMITFAQQWGIRQFVDEKALHAQIQENKKKPAQKSKFQQKLEEMAKTQQKPVKKK